MRSLDSSFLICEAFIMNVKTARRTLDLFEAFAEVKAPLTLSDLSRHLEWPISSSFALVRTLETRGFLYSVSQRRGFYPTRRMLDRTTIIAEHDPIAEQTGAVLSHLRYATGETVLLGRLQVGQVVYLNIFEPQQSIRYSAKPGDVKPLHSSAMGKALLAGLADEDRDALLSTVELRKVTPFTITSRARLVAHLDEGSRRGWQMTRSENVSDVMAIAKSVWLAGEQYGIAIAGPVHRMDVDVDRHVKALQEACGQLELSHGDQS